MEADKKKRRKRKKNPAPGAQTKRRRRRNPTWSVKGAMTAAQGLAGIVVAAPVALADAFMEQPLSPGVRIGIGLAGVALGLVVGGVAPGAGAGLAGAGVAVATPGVVQLVKERMDKSASAAPAQEQVAKVLQRMRQTAALPASQAVGALPAAKLGQTQGQTQRKVVRLA